MSNPKQNVLNYEGLQYFYEKIADNLMPSDLPTQVDANSTAIAGIQTNLNDKVNKVDGKGLSTNDYTTAEKNKLAGIASGATKVIIDTTLTETGQAAEAAAVNQQFKSINQALSGKASTAEATTSAAGLMSAADKTKLNSIAANAEVNQNAFTNIKVGTKTIAADSKIDTLTFAAGDNITLDVNTSSDTITISATDTKLTLDTTLNISGRAADAKATGVAINSVNSQFANYVTNTYLTNELKNYATSASLSDYVNKTTYNGNIDEINNNFNSVRLNISDCQNAINNCVTKDVYTAKVDNLSSSIININNTLNDKASVSSLAATDSKVNDLHNAIDSANLNIGNLSSSVSTLSTNVSAIATNLSNLQDIVNNKQNIINGAASSITTSNLSASKVLISNSDGKVAASSITTTELNCLAGLNTAVQNKFNNLDDQITGLQSNLTASKTELTLIDKVNGYTYVLEMANGQLRSSCKIDETRGIACEVMPLMTTGYIEGQLPDLEGLKIIAYCEDGSTKVLEDYTCSPIVNGVSTITYTELGITYTTTISLGATTAANLLKDFNYTSESNGTEFTLNGWKQTSNGTSSTELNVPNNSGVSI